MSTTYILRDIDNRDDGGAPYETEPQPLSAPAPRRAADHQHAIAPREALR